MSTVALRKSFVFDDTVTVLSESFQVPSMIFTHLTVLTFDSTNNVTRTVAFSDPDGISLLSQAAIADNSATIQVPTIDSVAGKEVPILGGNYSITVTLSGAAGGTGGTDIVTLWGYRA